MMRRDQVRLALVPPDRYPRLVEAATPMTTCRAEDQDVHDKFGTDLFIAWVQARAVSATTASAAIEQPATGQPAG
jgi:TetR/AcrR family transcriptional regulator, tetracycline repressor protein